MWFIYFAFCSLLCQFLIQVVWWWQLSGDHWLCRATRGLAVSQFMYTCHFLVAVFISVFYSPFSSLNRYFEDDFNKQYNSCSRVRLENRKFSQLVSKFYAFYGTRMPITVLTGARHWSVSWDRECDFILREFSKEFVLISFHHHCHNICRVRSLRPIPMTLKRVGHVSYTQESH